MAGFGAGRRKLGRFAALGFALAISGCEQAPGSPATSPATTALEAAAATALREGQGALGIFEAEEAMDNPRRPGDAILGVWNVWTPATLTIVARMKDPADHSRPGELHAKYERATPLLMIHPWQIELQRAGKRVVREYDVLRETPQEVEIQLRGGAGERAVVTIRGENELHAPDLAELVGAATWRRCHHPCTRLR